MTASNIVELNTEALELATSLLCAFRENGFAVSNSVEKSHYASAHFLRFLTSDDDTPQAYKRAALRASVDNGLSLLNGAELLSLHYPPEVASALREQFIKELVHNFVAGVESILLGASARVENLLKMEAVVSSSSPEAWEGVLDDKDVVDDPSAPKLGDMLMEVEAKKTAPKKTPHGP